MPESAHAEAFALKYVCNDYCSPTISIVGQILAFLESLNGKTDDIAILEPQAGGACRAGNIYNLIIEVLEKAGYGHIPVISLNMTGSEQHEGFHINSRMIFGSVAAVCYADLLMTLTQQIQPYELHAGETEALRQAWISRLSASISCGKGISRGKRRACYQQIVSDFGRILQSTDVKMKVGIVGEIYIKFSKIGNCHLEDFLTKRDCDYRMGGFVNYAAYVVFTELSNARLQKKNQILLKGYETVLHYICKGQAELQEVLAKNKLRFDAGFAELQELGGQIIDEHYNIGDGWLMAAEILDMIQQGYEKILIVHPFGCMVSHVGGRGIIKKIRMLYPQISIQSIEYDYDQTKTLRESRLLLGISDNTCHTRH